MRNVAAGIAFISLAVHIFLFLFLLFVCFLTACFWRNKDVIYNNKIPSEMDMGWVYPWAALGWVKMF